MMQSKLSLAPRYHLDDETVWLVGIDPVRRYWIQVNGDSMMRVAIPGLLLSEQQEFKSAILDFRSLQPDQTLTLSTFSKRALVIHRVAENLYAIPHPVDGAIAWHLFDRETIESFLLTAHEDWKCAPQDVALGRELVFKAWQQSCAA
ncbi:MAG: hypothetical protein AAGB13_11225 [Cyanobacteria bacterium P01_F01_bin.33]